MGAVRLIKIQKSKQLIVLMSSLLVSACATSYVESESVQQEGSVPVENRAVVDGDVLPLPSERPIRPQAMDNEAPPSPVVKKLMSTAQTQREAGNLEGAANSLERALRIEPRNAKLWSRLADLRYAQKLWRKSIQLANKSNTLVGGNSGLRRQNWYLIANAYTALGDTESSRRYREKLRK